MTANGKKLFDIKPYIIKIPRNKKKADGTWEKTETEYLPVSARIAWFRTEHPKLAIDTEIEALTEGKVRVRATIYGEDNTVLSSAMKTGDKARFGDYVEKAETGAIGRALSLAGYDLASAPDLDEEDMLANAPIERKK